MDRSDIAKSLEEIAMLLSLRGDNAFKVRAFENAAGVIASRVDLDELLARGELRKVKGIGKGLVEVVTELAATGRSTLLDELRREFPSGLSELVNVPGLGPKKAAVLWRELGVADLDGLEEAIQRSRIEGVAGFGARMQAKIAEGLAFVRQTAGRWRMPEALSYAALARRALETSEEGRRAGLVRVELTGELRRSLETVTGVVLAVACERPEELRPLPAEDGVPPVSVVAARPESFGNLWLLTTGAAAHVAELRVRDGAGVLDGPASTEEELYARLGLPFIPPELREGRHEVERAAAGHLPALVAPEDIRGVFHVHSTYSDGRATLEEVFQRCVELGFAYVGLSDHSPAAAYARGLSPERVREQQAEIEALAPRFPSLTVFRGTEADILPDGSIDYGDDLLAGFDFVIASVHSAFHLSRAEQTKRLVRAVSNPRVTLLGHATGRLLLTRSGFDVDLEAVLKAAGAAGCGVETNGSPHRLELDWRWGEAARAARVFTSVNPDAHDLPALEHFGNGVAIARKAGFSKAEVLNTGTAAEVGERLARLRARG